MSLVLLVVFLFNFYSAFPSMMKNVNFVQKEKLKIFIIVYPQNKFEREVCSTYCWKIIGGWIKMKSMETFVVCCIIDLNLCITVQNKCISMQNNFKKSIYQTWSL